MKNIWTKEQCQEGVPNSFTCVKKFLRNKWLGDIYKNFI